MPVVQLSDVVKSYGHGPEAVRALDGLSLVVESGERLAITGPSGSGKSTLLNLVAGLDVPTSGRILVNGCDLAGLSDRELCALRLREIGFVFQSFNLFPALTVAENVAWPLEFSGVPRARIASRVELLLAQVGVAQHARRRPGELSGGEQQRVAIARALVNAPSLVLADEPTGNLDSRTGQVILDLLEDLNRRHGVTILLVTHRIDAAGWGSRTVEVCDGRIVREERPARCSAS